ncbi:uncharacterized protein AMSG_11757 [Thecamonas trahens ATCC 50062]|uniref:Uncharacterized protein n=1 Tax=Thecamonas trahens ATCC 50062 TaxID=461836 RepID=A0A0L0D350_THETB|nr:hypothetical protein AMSG_11757 [Thecamonas trahens ATCC 50062]KNC46772.1 hypothetical protein AMSG_11757 [Thecamonas trahens ATCC 50062]|eukprot:XP_013760255.1 hypothetical protein AMSG_11757 [Thecamonas trahens ATCC 50062]
MSMAARSRANSARALEAVGTAVSNAARAGRAVVSFSISSRSSMIDSTAPEVRRGMSWVSTARARAPAFMATICSETYERRWLEDVVSSISARMILLRKRRRAARLRRASSAASSSASSSSV